MKGRHNLAPQTTSLMKLSCFRMVFGEAFFIPILWEFYFAKHSFFFWWDSGIRLNGIRKLVFGESHILHKLDLVANGFVNGIITVQFHVIILTLLGECYQTQTKQPWKNSAHILMKCDLWIIRSQASFYAFSSLTVLHYSHTIAAMQRAELG